MYHDTISAVVEPSPQSLVGSSEHEELGRKHHYQFGQKSMALLGLSLSSDGTIYAFANRRPPAGDATGAPAPMSELYRSHPLVLREPGQVAFTLTLAAGLEGLLTLEPRGWPHVYEVHRMHFLGMFNLWGADEIDYQSHGATNRPRGIPANRAFAGVFRYDPAAEDFRQRAVLTLTDLETNGQSEEHVFVSAFDDRANGDPGGVFLTIRVNAANYEDGCARLEFTDGHTLTVPVDGTPQALSRLALNTTNSPL